MEYSASELAKSYYSPILNELQEFSKQTIEQGGAVHVLERGSKYGLYKFQTQYEYNHQMFGNSPVYQIFRYKDGKRVASSTNYLEMYATWRKLECGEL